MATCQQCGKPFQPKRSDAKYCGSTCRGHARKARLDGGTAPRTTIMALVDTPTGALTDATRAELGPIADTADGILLLTLAARIDAVPETSPALATLSREFAARKADTMALVTRVADPMDELKARRDRRRAV
jgi:hypothetical protein